MKTILFIAALMFSALLCAQVTDPATVEADTSSTYLIRLDDNTSLSGKILSRTPSEIIFQDITIGKVTIPVKKIVKMTRLSGDQLCILTTNDGKSFTGLLISHNDTELTLRTESLGDLVISNSKIRDIKLIEKEQMVDGKYYFKNPHPTRYFFGPSAIPMVKGEGYYQNAYILANSVQFGISDNFSMGGGIIIPIMFFITPKFGYKVADNLYLGGGVLAATTISSDGGFGVGVGYGSVTIGNKENNFTINGGFGAVREEEYNYPSTVSTRKWRFSNRPMFSFSGMTRVAPKLALITENWVFPVRENEYNYNTGITEYTNKYYSVITLGFRLMGEKNSFDIAAAFPVVGDGMIGVPYLDYVYKF